MNITLTEPEAKLLIRLLSDNKERWERKHADACNYTERVHARRQLFRCINLRGKIISSKERG